MLATVIFLAYFCFKAFLFYYCLFRLASFIYVLHCLPSYTFVVGIDTHTLFLRLVCFMFFVSWVVDTFVFYGICIGVLAHVCFKLCCLIQLCFSVDSSSIRSLLCVSHIGCHYALPQQLPAWVI